MPGCRLGYETGQVLADQASAWLGSQSSLPTVPGFACQPAALGLAGTSGARGLLGGVLSPAKTFPLDLFATVCMQ